jgi:hypothetical protein
MLPHRATALAAALLAACAGLPAAEGEAGWRPLFNGKDLAGWDTYLGPPHGEKKPLGLNHDPRKVFTVVTADGKPAIRISGEVFGALTTRGAFEDFHVKLEFKWGKKKWPPRRADVRDSGLLYHCVGPHGAGSGFWMKSLECQIQEGDCGDFWSVAGVLVDVTAERTKEGLVYKKGGKLFKGVTERIIKDADHEKKSGAWNTIEVLSAGGTSVHVINGKVNMILTKARHKVKGKEVPLTRGKLQLQSEGAEVFYRNITVRPIKKIPEEYLK